MANPMEGLCYLINTDGANPKQKFDDFINFCENGKPGTSPGGFAVVGGAEVRGVVDWLVHGLPLPVNEANFFATEPKPEGTMFCATLSETHVPWINIPAFMDFVKIGPLPNLADQDGQIKLASIVSLDDEFRRVAAVRVQVIHLLPPAGVESFSEAMVGSTTRRNEAASKLEEPLRSRVRELLGLR